MDEQVELVVGRNPVIECLHAQVPATALYVAEGTKSDERLAEAVHTCADRGIAVLEVSRQELDRMTGNGMHQGIGLQVPPFQYDEVEDVIERVQSTGKPGMIVALDLSLIHI